MLIDLTRPLRFNQPRFLTMITLIITVLLVAVAGDVTADDYQMMVNKCDAQVDCISCYNSSYLCHWCADNPSDPPGPDIKGTCHYKGSVYGCKYGASCSKDACAYSDCNTCEKAGCKWCGGDQQCHHQYSWNCAMSSQCFPNSECQRKEPLYLGSEWAPRAVAWSLILILLIATTCGGMVMFSCRRMKNAVARANQRDRELAMQTRQRMARRRELSDGADDYLLHDAGSDTGLEIGERTRSSDVLSLASLLDPCASCLYKTLGCCWAVGMVLLLVGSVLIALAWPHQPVVNYCNVELVWNRTLAMVVESALVKTDIEMESLVSIYNPNRLGARINQLSGNIYYKGAGIGTMALHNFEAPGGYVSDGLGLITYSALDRAAEMLIDYKWNKDLVLTVTGTISFDILWPNSEVLTSLSASLPPAVINVNKVPDQRYCKCQGNVTKGS